MTEDLSNDWFRPGTALIATLPKGYNITSMQVQSDGLILLKTNQGQLRARLIKGRLVFEGSTQ